MTDKAEQDLNMHNQYRNRELSWLQFNARVLQEAEDESIPLIERLRFIGIFSNNLDEFFKVRYATLKRIVEAGEVGKNFFGGISGKVLMEEITQTVIEQQKNSLRILSEINKELEKHNIFIIDETEVTSEQGKFISDYFIQKVSPAMVTIMIGELEKFPKLKDSAAYLAIRMIMSKEDATFESKYLYALIEIPRSINRFVVLPKEGDKQFIIILDDLIRFCLHHLFNIFRYETISAHMIKITRDAELDIESDLSKSFIDKISKSVKNRSKGDPVRLVYDENIDKKMLQFLLEKMEIAPTDSIIPGGRYHNRRDYMGFPSLGSSDLQFEPKEPVPIAGLSLEGSLLDKIAMKDYLLHAPYQTFSYVVKFLREAALDPTVKTVKITIYRLAQISHIASSLINAVKNGKDVTVHIELQARFDEEANIVYAQQMQSEGINLKFGVVGLKVHCKICYIERLELNKLKQYAIVSTGNFNESTARIYTDYTLFTSNPKICKEIKKVFDFFEVNYKIKKYRHLIVSPHNMRNALYALIETEINNKKEGLPCGIKLKINSLSDFRIIDKLYAASRAGVEIKLIVRGICCLIPGIKGMSENIEVISIIGKFLEHTRIFIFENGGNPKVFISSADFMGRSFDNRVEITCPIFDQNIKQQIIEMFEIGWSDNVKAREITAKNDNAYRRNNLPKVRSQFKMYDYYLDKINKEQVAEN